MMSYALLGSFLLLFLASSVMGDSIAQWIAGGFAAVWAAVKFIPMACDCKEPCSKGRCERGD